MKVGAFCQGAYVRTNSLVRKHIRCFFGCSNQGYDSVGVRESPLHRAKRPPSRVDFGTPPFSQPTYDVIMIFSQCSCHKLLERATMAGHTRSLVTACAALASLSSTAAGDTNTKLGCNAGGPDNRGWTFVRALARPPCSAQLPVCHAACASISTPSPSRHWPDGRWLWDRRPLPDNATPLSCFFLQRCEPRGVQALLLFARSFVVQDAP
jgi:hypothetical protein